MATLVALVSVNGSEPFRRVIKPWGKGKDGVWFAELNEQQCKRLKVDTGDRITVTLAPAEQVPVDLIEALDRAGLRKTWEQLSASDRRSLAEHVFEAAKPETRRRRIERVVERLGDVRRPG